LDDTVTEAVLHAAFLPFGDIKDVSVPLDQGTQKNRGFGFVTFQEACVNTHRPAHPALCSRALPGRQPLCFAAQATCFRSPTE
jgi:RNA recognition motif. (a.k.a. RRM, RBD, or RNP domain)